MPRQKSGLDYFSLDVALDSKFELIEAEFGLTGFAVVVKILQYIYGGQGYYCEWTNEVALLFSRKLCLSDGGSVVSEIVSASIRRGMFDKDLYDKYQVLTSKGIQKRYFEAVSRRKEIEVKNSILLVNVAQICPNVNIISENVNIKAENVNISKQSKVKKSKEEKSRVKESIDYQRIADMYNNTCVSFQRCTSLSDKRKAAIRARLNTYSYEDFQTLFDMAESSQFLKGKNNRDWTANFDWLIKDGNMAKVLDGNYTDKADKTGTKKAVTSNPFLQQLQEDEYEP